MKKTQILIAGLAVGALLAPAAHAGEIEPPNWEICTVIGPPLGPVASIFNCDRIPRPDKPKTKKRPTREKRDRGHNVSKVESGAADAS